MRARCYVAAFTVCQGWFIHYRERHAWIVVFHGRTHKMWWKIQQNTQSFFPFKTIRKLWARETFLDCICLSWSFVLRWLCILTWETNILTWAVTSLPQVYVVQRDGPIIPVIAQKIKNTIQDHRFLTNFARNVYSRTFIIHIYYTKSLQS